MGEDERTRVLQERLDVVRQRIREACRSCGRDPDDLTLVVVTKTWPVDDVIRLVSLGVRDVGENRDQEASVKAAAAEGLGLRWHFVGQLQTNKAASVARYADLVHSVDRSSLVSALERGAAKAGRRVGCLLEIDLTDGAEGRGGVAPGLALDLAGEVAAAEHLDLRGVMGVAPLAEGEQGPVSAEAFGRLRDVAEAVRRDHPEGTLMSAGMSDDLEEAIQAGATHLRVGSAVLGTRPPLG